MTFFCMIENCDLMDGYRTSRQIYSVISREGLGVRDAQQAVRLFLR